MFRHPKILPTRRRRVVTPIRLVQRLPCTDVVELCDTMADRAREGNFRAVAVAYLTERGVGAAFAFGDQDWRLLPFAVDCLKQRMGEP